MVSLLLEHRADPDHRDNNGWTPLIAAATNNHVEILKLLIDAGATLDLQEKDGRTALMVACVNGHADSAGFLLSAGADCTKVSSTGASALFLAAYFGFAGIVKLLLDANQSMINVANNDGSSPLFAASAKGHDDVVRLLIERGATLDQRNNNGRTPLIAAATNNHVEILKLLIDAGATLDLQNDEGFTALMLTCLRGHAECTRSLLAAGADCTKVHSSGSSALFIAAEKGFVEIATLLLDTNKSMIDIADNDSWSPLLRAAFGGHADMVSLLLEHRADPDHRDNNGWTPLIAAATNNHVEILKLLIDAGATLDLRDKDCRTALMMTCIQGNLSAAGVLLDGGAYTAYNCEYGSPLTTAAFNGFDDLILLLLEFGADVNGRFSAARLTALHSASAGNRTSCIRVLLKAGCNINARSTLGCTAALFAAENGNCEALSMLIAAGADVAIPGRTSLLSRPRRPRAIAQAKGHERCVFLLDHPDQCGPLDFEVGSPQFQSIRPEPSLAMLKATAAGVMQLTRDFSYSRSITPGSYLRWFFWHLSLQAMGRDEMLDILEKMRSMPPFSILISFMDWSFDGFNGFNGFHAAARDGNFEYLKYLATSPVLIGTVDGNGRSALFFAAAFGHTNCVKLLLDHGSDPDVQAKDGWTPLIAATVEGFSDVVRVLLVGGADPTNVLTNGRSALHVAAQHGFTTITERLLRNEPTLVDVVDSYDKTALDYSCAFGHAKATQLLLDAGANPNNSSKSGTCLTYAAHFGHADLILLLLQYGAKVDAPERSGKTALHCAAQAGRASCVRLLLQAGCDVNARSRLGSTAALFAAEKGHFNILRLLIGAGADITIPRRGKPRDVARSNGHGDCVYLLDNPGQFPVDIKPGSLVICPRAQRPVGTESDEEEAVDDSQAVLLLKSKRALYVEANLRRARRLLGEFKSTSTTKALEANQSARLLEADLARLSPVSSLHMDPMPLLGGRVREALERSDTLHSFVVRGDVRRMRSRKLLRSGKFGPVVLNCLDREGRSPLYSAFVHNQPHAFAALLKAECLLDDAFPDGHPLLAVITKPAILDEMLRAKVDVNATSRGTTALVAAIQGGHVDSARKLLSHGADPLLPADGVNAMHAIRAFPDTVVAKGLLCRAHGMHPHLVDAAVRVPPPAPPLDPSPFPVIAGHDSELHQGFALGNASYRNNAGGGDCAFFALHNLDPTLFSRNREWTRAAARALLGSYSAPIDLNETGYTHEELRGMFEDKNFVNLPALWAIQLYLSGRVRAETVGQFELIQYACVSASSSVHRSIERFHLEMTDDDTLALRCEHPERVVSSRFIAFAEGVGFSHGHYFNVYPTADVPRPAGWHRPGSEQDHVFVDHSIDSDEAVDDNSERVWQGKYGNFWFTRQRSFHVSSLGP
ncbi:Ankyrin repeats (3 copies) [Carpediemonas membranifera]|uniref:Ankyrin repeats (3 copies) n=1 Tax=Carpediemonas membranifera TaxID=201153 RepID=A0A8J6E1I5_9EUKA|nr:Ankyrin repeats (3 copies) [Carpediemonas membranifera]|eukprot:KAG9396399.1 Ankyrin repeats (3 copies) [Carpediemonas membranifera]